MFVDLNNDWSALLLRDCHRNDLLREPPGFLGFGPAGLAAGGKGVLIRPADIELDGHIVRRLGHRVDTPITLHLGIDEPPTYGRVKNAVRPREGGVGFRYHEGSAAHAFYAARNHKIAVTSADRAGRLADCVHPGAAQPVDRRARDGNRQTGQQHRHAGNVAIVFARLIGTAVNQVVHRGPVDPWIAVHQGL